MFLQTQDASSVQQLQGCPLSESPPCYEGAEQHEEPIFGYGICTTEAPAQHPAELAAIEADSPTATPEEELCLSSSLVADKQEQAAPQATPDTPLVPLTHQQQTASLSAQLPSPHPELEHTAAFAEAKVPSMRCACCFLNSSQIEFDCSVENTWFLYHRMAPSGMCLLQSCIHCW